MFVLSLDGRNAMIMVSADAMQFRSQSVESRAGWKERAGGAQQHSAKPKPETEQEYDTTISIVRV